MPNAKCSKEARRDAPNKCQVHHRRPLPSLALFLRFFLSIEISFPFNNLETDNLLVKITKLSLKSKKVPQTCPPAAVSWAAHVRGHAWGEAHGALRGVRLLGAVHVEEHVGGCAPGCAQGLRTWGCTRGRRTGRAGQPGPHAALLPGFAVALTTRWPATAAGTSR